MKRYRWLAYLITFMIALGLTTAPAQATPVDTAVPPQLTVAAPTGKSKAGRAKLRIRLKGKRLGKRARVLVLGKRGPARGYRKLVRIKRVKTLRNLPRGRYVLKARQIRRSGATSKPKVRVLRVRLLNRKLTRVLLRYTKTAPVVQPSAKAPEALPTESQPLLENTQPALDPPITAQATPPANLLAMAPNQAAFSQAIAADGTRYLGGNFTRIAPQTGGFAALATDTGNADLSMPNVRLATNGYLTAVEPDGSGGVYLGGNFTQVNGVPRSNLAHIQADGSLDPVLVQGADGPVFALEIDGSTLYAGGSFTQIEGVSRTNLAGVNTSTGATTSWDPGADGSVSTLLIDGATIYVGGSFGNIGGAARDKIAALDTTTDTNNATTWNPGLTGSRVGTLALGGTTLYAGGIFTEIGGAARDNIAALDTTTDTNNATTWNPGAGSFVTSVDIDSANDLLYVGGDFTSIGGATRNRIAALSTTTDTNNATAWDPNASFRVDSVALVGSSVLVGGAFWQVGSQGVDRNRLARIAPDGGVDDWNPSADSIVYSMELDEAADSLYVGGSFTNVGGAGRNYIAALGTTTDTNNATAWNPNADFTITTMQRVGTTLYIGGDFRNVGGQARDFIAALDTSTGNATAWNPDASTGVKDLLVDGTTVYVAGDFATIGGASRNRIAALETGTDTNNATTWNPDATGLRVMDLELSGTILYAGGTFTAIGGQSRSNIAALDTAVDSNNATDWNPGASSSTESGEVNALAVDGNIVYAAGFFDTIGGSARNRIGALETETDTNNATTWNPDFSGGAVDLMIADATLYAVGHIELNDAPSATSTFHAITLTLNRAIPPLARAVAMSGTRLEWTPGWLGNVKWYWVVYRPFGQTIWKTYAYGANNVGVEIDNSGVAHACSTTNTALGWTCPMPYGWNSGTTYEIMVFMRSDQNRNSSGTPVQVTYVAP